MFQKDRLLRFIKNGWWLVLLAVAAAVAAAWVATSMATPLYQSSIRYVISPSRTTASPNYGDMVYGIDALSRRSTVATYVEIFQSERAIDGAASALGLHPEALKHYAISAVVLPETSVIHLAATGPNPNLTQQLATGVSAEAVAYILDLYDVYDVNLLDKAKTPLSPISPNGPRTILLAAVLGFMLGMLLALLRTPEILSSDHERLAQQPALPIPPSVAGVPADTSRQPTRAANTPQRQAAVSANHKANAVGKPLP